MSGKSPDEELRGGDVNPGFGARDGAVIDAVGEEATQPGKHLVDGADDKPGTVAILDIGGVHLRR